MRLFVVILACLANLVGLGGSSYTTTPELVSVRVHLVNCTAGGQKDVSVSKVGGGSFTSWRVEDVNRGYLILQIEPGYYVIQISEGRCWTFTGFRLVVLPNTPRSTTVTLVPQPGRQRPGEFTLLDVIKVDAGAIAGTLPLEALAVHLSPRDRGDGDVSAVVEGETYYVDRVPPGDYVPWIVWANWAVALDPVSIKKDSVLRKDVTLEELRAHIAPGTP